jgi:hypothetical protein
MAFADLLVNRCSWYRRINVGENEYAELIYSDVTMGSDVPCSRQVGHGLNMRQLIQDTLPTEYDRKIVKYWMEIGNNIQEGDIISFEGSETGKVRDVRDAAGRGHHLEVVVESMVEVGEEDSRIG